MNWQERFEQHQQVLASIEQKIAALVESQQKAEKRADRADKRMDRHEKRMERFDKRLESLGRIVVIIAHASRENQNLMKQVFARIDQVNRRFDRLLDLQVRGDGRNRSRGR